MRLFALLLALFACSANALVLRAPLRAGAVAPAAAGRAPSVAMRDVVRVEIELEQGEPYAAPRPLDASPRLRRPCCARSGASRPAAQFSAPPAPPPRTSPTPTPAARRMEKALRRFRKGVNMSGHLRVLRNRKQFESNHDKQIRKDKESAMRRARARRGQRTN